MLNNDGVNVHAGEYKFYTPFSREIVDGLFMIRFKSADLKMIAKLFNF